MISIAFLTYQKQNLMKSNISKLQNSSRLSIFLIFYVHKIILFKGLWMKRLFEREGKKD